MRGKWEGVNEPHWLEIEGPFRAPKGTRLLTPRDLLSRDSESFGRRFRGAGGTIKVPIGPQKLAIETESAAATERLPKTLAGKAENAKRREDSLSALSVNPSGPFFRRKVKSSPSRTLFVTTLRLLAPPKCITSEPTTCQAVTVAEQTTQNRPRCSRVPPIGKTVLARC